MMLNHWYIAENVIVYIGIFAWPKVPLFLFRIIRSALQSFQLIVEVNDIECLLVL